ncbi:MAG: zinc-ribbon domain-containing protein [Opitutaceae bacterium]|nr:zinc-ribbon domain-containing protein [Opitutaceae bacterium]
MAELLSIARPSLLKEWDFEKNIGISVEAVRINAGSKVSWRCQTDNRHRWEARIRNRAIDGNGCPYCSGRKTLREESFGVLHPEIANELHATKNPHFNRFAVSPGSNKIARWICSNGHEWKSEIARRVRTKSECPKCAYVKGRPMLAQSPLASEFHSTKNGKLKLEMLTLGTRRRVWWQCATDPTHAWPEAVNYRHKTGNRCPECYPRGSGRRETLDQFPGDLCREWHSNLNGSLTPRDVTIGSSTKVWWQCVKNPTHPAWLSVVRNRTINKQGCPKCAARAFDEKHSIAVMFPELAKEWDLTKNEPWTPANVTFGSSRKVWWRCGKDPAHEWQSVVNVRTKRNRGCPLCSGQMVTPERSLAGLFPSIAAEWHPTKNGALTSETVKGKSGKKVFWQCATNATHEWRAQIKNRTINESGCPECARENNILRSSRS